MSVVVLCGKGRQALWRRRRRVFRLVRYLATWGRSSSPAAAGMTRGGSGALCMMTSTRRRISVSIDEIMWGAFRYSRDTASWRQSGAGNAPVNCGVRPKRCSSASAMATFDTVGEDEISKSAVRKRGSEAAPDTENETVVAFPSRTGTEQDQPPRREYLTEKEVNELCDAARTRGRWGHRDATMIMGRLPSRVARQRACGVALGTGRPWGWPVAGDPQQGQ
jgi:hypothetical protein